MADIVKSFGKIKLIDNDTIFKIEYDGTVRFIIEKSSGEITIGAVAGTGAGDLNADAIMGSSFSGADFNLSGYCSLKNYTSLQLSALTVPEGTYAYDSTLHKAVIFTGSNWETITSV